MNYIADVNADLELDAPVGRDVMVALGQGALDLDRALRRFQRTAEFYKESVTDCFDFGAVKARKDRAQQLPMFFKSAEPNFSNRASSALRICRSTSIETQIPPAPASASIREAMFTPSPYTSPLRWTTSPM